MKRFGYVRDAMGKYFDMQTEKVNIDKENWPKNYWDNNLQCEICEIRWPDEPNFETCPICESDTRLELDHRPDMRWPDAVTRLLEERFERYYLEREIPEEQWENWEDELQQTEST